MNECPVLYGLTAKVRATPCPHTGFFTTTTLNILTISDYTLKVRAVRVT